MLQPPPPWLQALACPAHLDTALRYVGTREVGRNRGVAVERFLASVGLWEGNPYCAAFVSYALTRAGAACPTVRSGLARHFITASSVEARLVLRGVVRIEPGTIVVWQKGETIYGHAGFVVWWEGARGETVEANTGPGSSGSQREGDGVWRRRRVIEPGSYFRITHFTPVRYAAEQREGT